jgi:hypothetical protein
MKTIDVIDKDGKTTTRPMTLEEECEFEQMFQDELEADHEDDN